MKKSKKKEQILEGYQKETFYEIDKALEILEKFPKAKFDETVEVHIKTAANPKKSEQQIRASVVLPHGTGKVAKIGAFTTVSQKEAKSAGADVVGGEDLIEKIKQTGKIDFNVAVATPEMMPKLAKIAKILGPRGLMPNPKTQTVGPKIEEMILALKKGRLDFKSDDGGNVHAPIGKRSFGKEKLLENYKNFVEAVSKNKPNAVKGKFIKGIALSATMTPGIKISE